MFRIVSLSVVLTLIVILGITFFRVVAPFLLPLFLAGVAAILAQPLFLYFVRRTKGRVRLASGLATATIVFAILAPLSVGTVIASFRLYYFAKTAATSHQWDQLFGAVQLGAGGKTESAAEWIAKWLNEFTGAGDEDSPVEGVSSDGPPPLEGDPGSPSSDARIGPRSGDPAESFDVMEPTLQGAAATAEAVAETPSDADSVDAMNGMTDSDEVAIAIRSGKRFTPEQVKALIRSKFQSMLVELGDRSLGIFTGVVFSIFSAFIGLLIFIVALYYFFADGTALQESTQKLIPVHVEYQREMLNEFARAVRGVVSATFLAALGQAVATIIPLWLVGFDHLLTLFVLCMLSAMIPALGTWLVWGPCAVLLLVSEPSRPVAATLLVIYGAVFVGLLDNVIRTYVLNSDTKLHPLLALISVLGGLQMMGLWGVFVGPIVASCLYALVRIFNHELTALSQSRFGDQAAAAANTLITAADAEGLEAAGDRSPARREDGTQAAEAAIVKPATAAAPPVVTGKSSKGQKSGKRRR